MEVIFERGAAWMLESYAMETSLIVQWVKMFVSHWRDWHHDHSDPLAGLFFLTFIFDTQRKRLIIQSKINSNLFKILFKNTMIRLPLLGWSQLHKTIQSFHDLYVSLYELQVPNPSSSKLTAEPKPKLRYTALSKPFIFSFHRKCWAVVPVKFVSIIENASLLLSPFLTHYLTGKSRLLWLRKVHTRVLKCSSLIINPLISGPINKKIIIIIKKPTSFHD